MAKNKSMPHVFTRLPDDGAHLQRAVAHAIYPLGIYKNIALYANRRSAICSLTRMFSIYANYLGAIPLWPEVGGIGTYVMVPAFDPRRRPVRGLQRIPEDTLIGYPFNLMCDLNRPFAHVHKVLHGVYVLCP